MQDKFVEILDKLATKLGVASSVLWEALLKQAKIDAIATTIQYVLIISFLACLAKITPQCIKKINEHDECWYIVLIVVWIFALFPFLIAFYSLPSYFAAMFNPEYWALNEILRRLK